MSYSNFENTKNDLKKIDDPYILTVSLINNKPCISDNVQIPKLLEASYEAIQKNDVNSLKKFLDEYYYIFIQSSIPQNDQISILDDSILLFSKILSLSTPFFILYKVLIMIDETIRNSKYYNKKLLKSNLIDCLLFLLSNSTISEQNELDDMVRCLLHIFWCFITNEKSAKIVFEKVSPTFLFRLFQNHSNNTEIINQIIHLIDAYIDFLNKDQILPMMNTFYELFEFNDNENYSTEIKILLFSVIGSFSKQFSHQAFQYIINTNFFQKIISNIIDILEYKDSEIVERIFCSLILVNQHKIPLLFPVESIFQAILSKQISLTNTNLIVHLFSLSIYSQDNTEYNKIFLVSSLKPFIEYVFENGTVTLKHHGFVLFTVVVSTKDLNLICEYINSDFFPIFVEYFVNTEDLPEIIIMIGALGTIYSLLKAQPPSTALSTFLTILSENDVLNFLNNVIINAFENNNNSSSKREIIECFYNMIQSDLIEN